ncbi:YafY family transcriptional regulator [bacterium]|nr:MAG: YafY family transcriptional regulator [bacterium]
MSDSIKSADRRLKLLLLLQSGKHLSVNKIADYFNISRRTVFRDLRALQELDVPITHDMVEGYSLVKGYKVPPLMFNERELASIILGLSFIKTQADNSMSEDAKQVLLKIKTVLPGNLLEFVHAIEDNVITSPYYLPEGDESKSGNWFIICQAIADKSAIQITYSTGNESTSREIHPYYIVLYGDHWNVIGYDTTKNDTRNFRLANISAVQLLPERFNVLKKNRDEFIYNFRTESIESYQIKIDAEIKNEFLTKFPGKISSIGEEDGMLKITFSFDNSEWLSRFLISYLQKIEILTDELKHLIKKKLNELSGFI